MVKRTMRIGSYNVFEHGASINSTDIGDGNEFGINCKVSGGCLIGHSCVVAPTVIVPAGTKVSSFSVCLGEGRTRKNLQPKDAQHKYDVKQMS